ncbi:MAG: nucleoside recognition domain-containing protein [Bacilli bacterium]|nr:nucleoside recognition domain-containing protein [Bacilli bacterium]MDD3896213.1 nucleoside recognition domain-containing protein [Bacilli bacterium]MDD4407944.1 nucleoside recognition domain-containing protein [Bacilli bacterium]
MVNIIWGIFIIIGISYSIITGNALVINNEIIASGKAAFDLILDMMPLLVIWMGLMKIAEKSGLIKKIAELMTPILSLLFPKIPRGHESIGYIASNVAVNMAGLGSAATPFGLKAMQKLQELNPDKKRATTSMITFLVLNTSGVTIVPTTIISLRMMYGSANPTIIIPTCILATICAGIGGLTLDYIIRRKNDNN